MRSRAPSRRPRRRSRPPAAATRRFNFRIASSFVSASGSPGCRTGHRRVGGALAACFRAIGRKVAHERLDAPLRLGVAGQRRERIQGRRPAARRTDSCRSGPAAAGRARRPPPRRMSITSSSSMPLQRRRVVDRRVDERGTDDAQHRARVLECEIAAASARSRQCARRRRSLPQTAPPTASVAMRARLFRHRRRSQERDEIRARRLDTASARSGVLFVARVLPQERECAVRDRIVEQRRHRGGAVVLRRPTAMIQEALERTLHGIAGGETQAHAGFRAQHRNRCASRRPAGSQPSSAALDRSRFLLRAESARRSAISAKSATFSGSSVILPSASR